MEVLCALLYDVLQAFAGVTFWVALCDGGRPIRGRLAPARRAEDGHPVGGGIEQAHLELLRDMETGLSGLNQQRVAVGAPDVVGARVGERLGPLDAFGILLGLTR